MICYTFTWYFSKCLGFIGTGDFEYRRNGKKLVGFFDIRNGRFYFEECEFTVLLYFPKVDVYPKVYYPQSIYSANRLDFFNGAEILNFMDKNIMVFEGDY